MSYQSEILQLGTTDAFWSFSKFSPARCSHGSKKSLLAINGTGEKKTISKMGFDASETIQIFQFHFSRRPRSLKIVKRVTRNWPLRKAKEHRLLLPKKGLGTGKNILFYAIDFRLARWANKITTCSIALLSRFYVDGWSRQRGFKLALLKSDKREVPCRQMVGQGSAIQSEKQ